MSWDEGPALVRRSPVHPVVGGRSVLPLEWRIAEGEEQAFAADLPAVVPCAAPLPRIEEGLVEFDTRRCGSTRVVQVLGETVEAGCVLTAVASHTILLSSEPAVGHMRVALENEILLDWTVPIPGPADLHVEQAVLRQTLKADTRVGIHVSNHGANNWRLVSLTVSDCPAPRP